MNYATIDDYFLNDCFVLTKYQSSTGRIVEGGRTREDKRGKKMNLSRLFFHFPLSMRTHLEVTSVSSFYSDSNVFRFTQNLSNLTFIVGSDEEVKICRNEGGDEE
jgi:hypothetical protein